MRKLTDIAWLAGLIEGEGCIRSKTSRPRRDGTMPSYPNIHVGMTDEDVVRRAHAVVGLGQVHGPYLFDSQKFAKLPRWVWAVQRSADAVSIALTIYPFMGARRRQAICDVVLAWRGQESRYGSVADDSEHF